MALNSWEDEESGPPAAFVSSRQDGEDSDVSDEEEDAPASKVTTGSSSKTVANDDPFTPAVVAVLSEAYIEHGLDVLIRPNKTAKPTPARSALMQRLQHAGWKGGEDLIQSWGRVLDRDVCNLTASTCSHHSLTPVAAQETTAFGALSICRQQAGFYFGRRSASSWLV